jgi:hypothetical protein
MWPLVISGGTLAVLTAVQAYRKAVLKKGVFTPERRERFDAAMNSTDEQAINELAAEFEREGLKKQAKTLRKRAALRGLPRNITLARRAIFRRAMKSKNAKAVLAIAKALEKEGAIDAARQLELYAGTLSNVHEG